MLSSISAARLILNAIALALIFLLVSLGNWQLDRSQFKSQRQALFQQRTAQPVRALPDTLVDSERWSYARVKASGRYLSEKTFFVDNVVVNGQVGVTVVTPFELEHSKLVVLVNRGWRSWQADRSQLPKVETPAERLELSGLLVPAASKHFYLSAPEDSASQEKLWLALDLARYQKSSLVEVQPLIMVLSPDQPGSERYIWKLAGDSWVARHKAYAVQWYALALTLLIIVIVLNWRKNKASKNES